jgi:hypothetical protein
VSYFLHKVIISTFTQNGCTFLMLNILWSVIQWGKYYLHTGNNLFVLLSVMVFQTLLLRPFCLTTGA